MNGRRIHVNVAVFLALAVTLTVWALKNVITPDFLSRPYAIKAEFTSSPGLHPRAEVAYLGVKVGRVQAVKLEEARHRVTVTLRIDRGVTIPAQVRAAAGRKSAVGEPYIDLSPVPGTDGARRLKPGSVIPLGRTSIPVSYGDLFGKALDALKAIDPESTKTLVHELAVGWEGREQSLRDLIAGTDQLTSAFAGKSAMLADLVHELTTLTRTLARHKGDLAATIDNSSAVLASLTDVKSDVSELLKRGPEFALRLARLMAKTQGTGSCTIDAVSGALTELAAPSHLNKLGDLLSMADEFKALLSDVISPTQQGPVLNLAFILQTGTKAPLEFQRQLPQPTVGAVPGCPNGVSPSAAPSPGGEVSSRNGDSSSVQPNGTSEHPLTTTGTERQNLPGTPTWHVYVLPVLALLILLGAAARAIAVLRRRHRS